MLSFAPRYLAFKIEFEDRAAHARLLQCVLPASMYRISSAMKIKHKMCGGKAMERDSFLFSLASSRYAGQTDRPNSFYSRVPFVVLVSAVPIGTAHAFANHTSVRPSIDLA